jgi:hypothetical protein
MLSERNDPPGSERSIVSRQNSVSVSLRRRFTKRRRRIAAAAAKRAARMSFFIGRMLPCSAMKILCGALVATALASPVFLSAQRGGKPGLHRFISGERQQHADHRPRVCRDQQDERRTPIQQTDTTGVPLFGVNVDALAPARRRRSMRHARDIR